MGDDIPDGTVSQRPDAAGIDVLDTSRAGALVIRGAVLRIGGYALGVALSIVGAVVLLRYLEAGDFGRYATVISLVTIVAGLTDAGMTNIGIREYSVRAAGAERAEVIRDLLGLRIVLVAAGVLVALAFALAARYDDAMVAGTALAGVGVLMTLGQATYSIPLQARLRLGWVTAIEVARQLLTAALIVALVVAGASLVALFAVPALAGAAALALAVALVFRDIPLAPSFAVRRWGQLLRVTLPYAAATGVGVAYSYLTVVLLSVVSSQEETGYFAAAFRIFIVLGGIPGLLVVSAFPVLARAARDDHARLAYALQRLFDISLILGVGSALLTFVGAPVAIELLAGGGFEPSVDVLRLQAGAVLSSYFVATWAFALLSLARYRVLLVVNSIALAASAAVTLALAPEHGAVGGGVATLVAETVLAIASGLAIVLWRSDLRPALKTLPKALAAGAVGAAALLVPGLSPAVELAAAAAGYVLVLFVLRAVPPEIGEALAAWRRQRAA